jgi:hypothetical protein
MKSRTISAEPVMIAGSNPSLMRISAGQPRKSKANDRVRRASASDLPVGVIAACLSESFF